MGEILTSKLSMRDAIYVAGILITFMTSYFTLDSKVAVLEERVNNQTSMFSSSISKLEKTLQRIEDKLDQKADR